MGSWNRELKVKMKTAGETRNHKKKGFPFALVGAVALIAVIVANVIVWNGYRSKQGQVEALKNEIVQVNEQVSQAAAPPSDLESRLKSAEGNLALARQTYPADIDRNDVFDFMLTTANECQVEILPLVWDGVENAGNGQSYLHSKIPYYHYRRLEPDLRFYHQAA